MNQGIRVPNETEITSISAHLIRQPFQPEDPNLIRAVDSFLQCKFTVRSTGEGRIIYEITNFNKKEVKVINNTSYLEDFLTEKLHANGIKVGSNLSRQLVSDWVSRCDKLKVSPESFALEGEDVWTFNRIKVDLKQGAFPAWEEFTSRLSDKDAFHAFVWSIFEKKHTGRQALYLHGPNGQDGKSVVIRTITSVFGYENVASLNHSTVGSKNQFQYAIIVGKRLGVYPDCKNTAWVKSEFFRSITSGDLVPIERKHQNPYTERVYLRLLIASNEAPNLTSAGADMSRLIYLEVNPSQTKDDPEWEEKLKNELPQFLHHCREVYKMKCSHHGDIQISQNSQQLLQDCADAAEERWEVILEEKFVLQPDACLPASEFIQICDSIKLTSQDVGNFKSYLGRKNVRSVQRKINGARQRVYAGITTPDKALNV